MPEVTDQYIRIPTGKRKKKGEKIRTITISKGIKALYDVKNKVVITYLFDVKKYTMKQAKEWVAKHKSSAAIEAIAENMHVIEKLNEVREESKKEAYKKARSLLNNDKV